MPCVAEVLNVYQRNRAIQVSQLLQVALDVRRACTAKAHKDDEESGHRLAPGFNGRCEPEPSCRLPMGTPRWAGRLAKSAPDQYRPSSTCGTMGSSLYKRDSLEGCCRMR